MAVELETRSVASQQPPWGYVTLWQDFGARATGYSIDLTPLTEPRQTYYAAINGGIGTIHGVTGFYVGLQRTGDRFERQLQFSVWDSPGGSDAQVVERGEGAICSSFGGEGSGQKCEFNYPWRMDATYRFEVTWEELDGGSVITGHITELATGERRFLGVLRVAYPLNLESVTTFVEQFRPSARTCLAQEVRSAAIRQARARIGGTWSPITRGILTRDAEDFNNRGTPPCANSAARSHADGLEIVMGGRTAMDPDISRVTIPQ